MYIDRYTHLVSGLQRIFLDKLTDKELDKYVMDYVLNHTNEYQNRHPLPNSRIFTVSAYHWKLMSLLDYMYLHRRGFTIKRELQAILDPATYRRIEGEYTSRKSAIKRKRRLENRQKKSLQSTANDL